MYYYYNQDFGVAKIQIQKNFRNSRVQNIFREAYCNNFIKYRKFSFNTDEKIQFYHIETKDHLYRAPTE